MAKLHGGFTTQSLGEVSIYRLNGHTYMRSKSSLSREQVLTEKNFEKTRQFAEGMGMASRLGSSIYHELPAATKKRSIYQAITGMAASLLYRGIEVEEVRTLLRKKFIRG